MTKTTSNQDLEDFLKNGNDTTNKMPWSDLDKNSKRVGVNGVSIVCNDYEKTVMVEAAKKTGLSLASFIRHIALEKSKTILNID